MQLQLIPSNHTYSGNKELTQYFIRWSYGDLIKSNLKMFNLEMFFMVWSFFRQSSMQLDTGNTTISVKVTTPHLSFLMTFVHICHICLILGANLGVHFSLILLINFSGCSGKKASWSFHDSIHADHSDEHCWTFNHVLQAVLLWSSGSQQTIKNNQMSWCLFSRSRST